MRRSRTARAPKRSRRVSKKSGRKARVSKRSSKPARKSKAKKSRRSKKAASPWNKHLMSVFKEMKKKDSGVKLGDAMKVAKKTYRK